MPLTMPEEHKSESVVGRAELRGIAVGRILLMPRMTANQ